MGKRKKTRVAGVQGTGWRAVVEAVGVGRVMLPIQGVRILC